MRTAVRAEVREMGVDALGMDSAVDADRAIASGGLPNVIVIEATAELLGQPRTQDLIRFAPAVLIPSCTIKESFPNVVVILYRRVRATEIVARVSELLTRNHEA